MSVNPGGPQPDLPRAGRVTRAKEWAQPRADLSAAWVLAARGGHASVAAGFRLVDRDKRTAAAVLSGGLAFVMFVTGASGSATVGRWPRQ